MARLPQIQNRYIAHARDFSAGAGAQIISQSLQIASNVASHLQNVQDTTTSIKEISDNKLNFIKKNDELKIKYADNPTEYEKQANLLLDNSKETLLNNSKVSFLNKSSYGKLLDNQIIDIKDNIYKDTRQLQVKKFSSDLSSIVENNNNLSYKYGKNNNIDEFEKLQNNDLKKLYIAGENVLSRNEINGLITKAKQENYVNYLQGQMVSNPSNVLSSLENKEYSKILGNETVDKIKSQAEKFVKDDTERIKQGTQIQEPEILRSSILELESFSDNIKTDEKNILVNKDYQGIQYLNSFNQKIENARQNGLSNKDYEKYKTQINNTYYKIAKTGDNIKDSFLTSTNSLKESIGYIDKYIPNNNQFVLNDLYGKTMSALSMAGVDLKSKDALQIKQAKDITESVIKDYYGIKQDDPQAQDKIKQGYNKEVKVYTSQVMQNTTDNIIKNNKFFLNTKFTPIK